MSTHSASLDKVLTLEESNTIVSFSRRSSSSCVRPGLHSGSASAMRANFALARHAGAPWLASFSSKRARLQRFCLRSRLCYVTRLILLFRI